MHTDCLLETLDEAAGLVRGRDTDADDEPEVSHAMDAAAMRAHMVELLYRTDLQGKRTQVMQQLEKMMATEEDSTAAEPSLARSAEAWVADGLITALASFIGEQRATATPVSGQLA